MAVSISKTCTMGSSQTGLVGTIGYTLLKVDGTVEVARSIVAIYEIGGGCYGKDVSFPDDFVGSIVWDTGGVTPVYAAEDCYIDALVNMVLDDTDELQTNQGDWATAVGFSVPNEYDVVIAALQTDLDNPAQYKADVANLDVAVSTRSAANEYDVVIAALQTDLDNPAQYKAAGFSVPGEYDIAIAALQTDLDNPAQYKADVTNLDVAVSTRNATAPPTVDQIATAIFTKAVEGALTFEQLQRILVSFAGGKTSGGGTVGIKFRDGADTKDRIDMTVDENGNRSAVTLDGT